MKPARRLGLAVLGLTVLLGTASLCKRPGIWSVRFMPNLLCGAVELDTVFDVATGRRPCDATIVYQWSDGTSRSVGFQRTPPNEASWVREGREKVAPGAFLSSRNVVIRPVSDAIGGSKWEIMVDPQTWTERLKHEEYRFDWWSHYFIVLELTETWLDEEATPPVTRKRPYDCRSNVVLNPGEGRCNENIFVSVFKDQGIDEPTFDHPWTEENLLPVTTWHGERPGVLAVGIPVDLQDWKFGARPPLNLAITAVGFLPSYYRVTPDPNETYTFLSVVLRAPGAK